jgi:hypothetical protein
MNVNTRQNDTGVIFGEFKSCTLVRVYEDGAVGSYTCLLPLKFAKEGKKLQIVDDNEWIDWMVLKVSDNIVTNPVDPRVLIKSHRKATGDSMPKRK